MAKLPAHVQLIAIGLLNCADDEGYFRASPELVRADISPFTEDSVSIHGALTTLSEVGWIEVCDHSIQGPIGRVVNFCKHQIVNRPTPSKLKCYWLTESSLSPHGVITESSLPEQGTGNREHVSPKPPSASGRKPSSVEEVITKGQFIGVSESDCRDWFRDCEACNWTRGDGTPFDNWPRQLVIYRDKLAVHRERCPSFNVPQKSLEEKIVAGMKYKPWTPPKE